MLRYMIGTSMVLGIVAAILTFMWEKEPPKPPLALSRRTHREDRAPAADRVREEAGARGAEGKDRKARKKKAR